MCLLLGSVFKLLGLGVGDHHTGDGTDPNCPMWGRGATVSRVVPGSAPQLLQLLPLRTFHSIHGEGGGDLARQVPSLTGESGTKVQLGTANRRPRK